MAILEEPEFIDRSLPLSAGGEKWRDRYFALKAGLKDAPRIMSTELGLATQRRGSVRALQPLAAHRARLGCGPGALHLPVERQRRRRDGLCATPTG
jgi:hypothetical protein